MSEIGFASKTKKAKEYLQNEDIKSAISIFKTFKMGVSEEDIRIMEIANDCIKGNGLFYSMIGIDGDAMIGESVKIMNNYFKREQ